ncbi:MAG: tyrosine-type recombinase/integrase [Chloroflexota bacterium]|nr:tyrosine-type recombinase/integrase [Chloroflexota bacterium]
MDERLPTAAEAVAAYLRDRQLGGAPRQSIITARASLKLLASAEPLMSIIIRNLLYDRCATVAPNTAIGIISTHRTFVRYCLARGWLLTDPLAGVQAPRKRDPAHRFLTPIEAQKVWEAAHDLLDKGALILLGHGLRAGEACDVRRDDVREDADGAYLYVRTEKGGPARLLPLDAAEARLLLSLPVRGAGVLGISRNQLWRRVSRLGRKAGIRLHPHLFRHSWALHWIEETGDQATLQTLGGWRSDSSPRWYVRSALERVALRRARQAGVGLFGMKSADAQSDPPTP